MSLQDLSDKTWEILEKHKEDIVSRWSEYALKILDNEERIKNITTRCHEWKPLRFYLSVNRVVGKGNMTLAVRFRGQDVAELCISQDRVLLIISANHVKSNSEYFEVNLGAGVYDWTGKEARNFRTHFRECANMPSIEEHAIESKIIEELERSDSEKFCGSLTSRSIFAQPVTLFGFPFQMPLPVSGSRGAPEYKKGNSDIIARMRLKWGGTPYISLLELKKMGKYGNVVPQSIIYSTAILFLITKIMKGEKPFWWNLFGFRRELPKNLKILSLAVVSSDQYKNYQNEMKNKENTIIRKNGKIISGCLSYDWQPGQKCELAIKDVNIPQAE